MADSAYEQAKRAAEQDRPKPPLSHNFDERQRQHQGYAAGKK